jgi:threonine/homoserine/homoserine lactone efflux protein
MQAAWPVFIVASLLLIIAPGQDMVLVVTRAVSRGARAGVVTAAGVSTGLVGHTLLAALGLGAILRASEPLFVVLKLVGAAYLVYLGIGMLRAREVDFSAGASAPRSLRRLFVDGVVSNVSNPKIAIFYLAFLPQFVAADAARPTVTIFILGLVFAALTFTVKGPMALSAGLLSGWLRSRPQVQRWMHRCSGVVLVALGARLALERRP